MLSLRSSAQSRITRELFHQGGVDEGSTSCKILRPDVAVGVVYDSVAIYLTASSRLGVLFRHRSHLVRKVV